MAWLFLKPAVNGRRHYLLQRWVIRLKYLK